MNIKQTQKGFTLIELMIVVAIVGILAAIALPAYSDYTKKAKFTQVIAAVGAAKTAIEVEYSGGKALTDLDGEETCTVDNTDPTDPVTVCVVGGFLSNFVVGQNSGRVELLEIADGVITAVGGGEFDTGAVTDVSYILTPSISNGSLNWATTGSCTTAGLC